MSARGRVEETEADNGGKECEGEYRQYKVCEVDKDVSECPKRPHSVWGLWGQWSDCMGECGKRGAMERIRTCIKINGGGECEGDGIEKRKCPNMCPPGMVDQNYVLFYNKEFIY